MIRKLTLFSTVLLLAFATIGTANATLINSAPGLDYDLTNDGIIDGTTVAITPHPLWQPTNPTNPGDPTDDSAVWISYKKSGYQDPDFQPFMGMVPVVSILHSFVSDAGLLTLDVWADDTANVYLDGVLLAPGAIFTQSICSGGVIGCRTQDKGSFSEALTAGSHTLRFELFQVGQQTNTTLNPFGILYTGTAPTVIPEPAAFALTGAGLLLVGLVRRNRNRKSTNS